MEKAPLIYVVTENGGGCLSYCKLNVGSDTPMIGSRHCLIDCEHNSYGRYEYEGGEIAEDRFFCNLYLRSFRPIKVEIIENI